jgi:threonine dehydrogenase-like Zn-dependent dehydrogenase
LRAVYLDQSGISFRSNYEPVEFDGEVPVRVLVAGICETDLQLVKGYMGFCGILGHEFVGVAESGKFAGQRVVGEINCCCGKCERCKTGLQNHCPNRSVIGILNHDGAFADRVYVPESNLHPVPNSVPDEIAVFTEPLAAAFQIPAQIDLTRIHSAVVVGDGRLAYLIAQVLRLKNCDVLVVGKHQNKLDRFRTLSFEARLLDQPPSAREFDLAVDCSGSPTGIPTALQFLRPRGILVLKTTVAGDHELNLAPLVIDEITIVGSRCGPFDVALAALENGEIEVKSLITDRFPLEQANNAFDSATRGSQGKILFDVAP